MSEKWTKAPWNICWATFDGRKVNFDITASPYGSVRPIAGSKWKTDWSDVEGEELIANAHLIASAPAMAEALEKAVVQMKVWVSINGDLVGALGEIISEGEAALSLARGEAK